MRVGGARLLTDRYDAPMSAANSKPLAGLSAWCGNDLQPWFDSFVDIGDYAGLTVRFRFRLGSDLSFSRPGWSIDDVRIQNCPPDLIFKEGF